MERMRKSHPTRIGRLLSAALTLMACTDASAAEYKPSVGDIVIARRADVLLQVEGVAPGVKAWGSAFRVRQVRGDWLWVGRGWLRAADTLTRQDAVAYFTRVIEDAPSAFALISRGIARREVAEFEAARADFDEAARLAPREPRTYRERALLGKFVGTEDAAIRDFSTAIELWPTDADSYIGRALALVYRSSVLDWNDFRLALDDLDRAVHFEPRHADAYATRASILYRFGKVESALPDAAEAIRLDAWFPPNYMTRAAIHWHLGHRALAAADFDFAERLDTRGTLKALRKLYETGVIAPEGLQHDSRATHLPEALLLSTARAAGAPAASGMPEAQRGATDVFDIPKGPNPVILPVAVKGTDAPLHFLVDTGSRLTAFSTVHQHLLGKKIRQARARTATGHASLPVHDCEPIMLGKTMLVPTWGVLCADLRVVELMLGTQLDGVLGSDVLRRIVLSTDFDNGKVSVLPSADESCGVPLHLIWHSGLLLDKGPFAEGPFVMATLSGGGPTEFLVDLGECDLLCGSLSPELFDSEIRRGTLLPIGGRKVIQGAVGLEQLETRHARARALSVAGRELNNLIFKRSDGFNSLGLGYLSRYTVTLDVGNDMMYLRPGKGFSRPDVENHSGLSLIRNKGELRLLSVTPDSPAWRAGCRTRDVVTHIDGVPASQMRFILEIERALCVPGKHVLRLRRDGVIHEATFVAGS